MRKLTLFLICLTSLSVAAPVQAASILQQFDGKWRGSGWAKRDAGKERQAMRCRLQGSYSQAAGVLSMKGRCSGGGASVVIDGSVRETHAGGYHGTWSGPNTRGPQSFQGRSSGKSLQFAWNAPDQNGGTPVANNVTWKTGDDRLVMILQRSNDSLAEITFSPAR